MSSSLAVRNGGRILVEQLRIHGVRHAFCVPGESYLPVLDALYQAREDMALIVTRQDGGAAFMAGAYGKLTGRPGVCFVTRGPGASNAAIGVHNAMQDSEPMVLFIGQVATDQLEREAFQEIDFRRMYGPMSKWAAQIERVERIPEYVSRAFHLAVSGRPGPVVLALPEDVLAAEVAVPDAGAYQVVQPAPKPADMARLRELLERAHRPLAILGGAGWTPAGVKDLQALIETFDLPVACAFRFQDLYDNRRANYVGDLGIGVNPALAERVRNADLVLAIGARLGEVTTQNYSLLAPPVPAQTLVHVHNDAAELGRVYQGTLLVNSGMNEFAAAARALTAAGTPLWDDWTRAARVDYETWQTSAYRGMPGSVELRDIVRHLGERLPEDAIYTNGGGNYAGWLHRFHRYRGFRTQLAPSSGSMGYGVPAAIAAKAAQPGRTVIAISGDGDYLMNGQELATAVHYGLAVVIVVVNNGMYGTIRMHQERDYPGRVYGTALTNPDFAALARAYGAHGETVTATAEFAPALERALASGRPALIEVRIEPDAISPQTTIAQLRGRRR